MLSLHYHKLMGKLEEYEKKVHLMVNDYVLDKVLDKIKETIGIEKFYVTKVLIDTDDKQIILVYTQIIKQIILL